MLNLKWWWGICRYRIINKFHPVPNLTTSEISFEINQTILLQKSIPLPYISISRPHLDGTVDKGNNSIFKTPISFRNRMYFNNQTSFQWIYPFPSQFEVPWGKDNRLYFIFFLLLLLFQKNIFCKNTYRT